MKSILKNLFVCFTILTIILSCSKDGIKSSDSSEFEKQLSMNYSLVEIDTNDLCITDSIVCVYKNKKGKIVKSGGEEFLIEIESPDKLQEQKLLYPCNLPKDCYIDGLDLLLDGYVEINPARNFQNDIGVPISIDGQQRIFLTKLLKKKN